MTGFSTRYATTLTCDFRIFALLAPIRFQSADGDIYELPKSSRSDLASIPRLLWDLLPPAGEDGAEYALAAFGHDLAYRNTLLRVATDGSTSLARLTKDQCDSLLKEMMLSCGVPEHIAEEIYLGVKLGGQSSFNADR